MFDVVAGAALVDDDFVADCRDRLCAGLLADFIQDVFGVGFGIAQDGDFDELVQFERKADVLDLIVANAVFADLEDRVYGLRHTAKFCALRTCDHTCFLVFAICGLQSALSFFLY